MRRSERPLARGGADEILLVGFDEARPEYAAVKPDVEDRQRDPGHDQRLAPAPGILGQRHVAECRHPGEGPGVVVAALCHEIDDLADPEYRHRHAHEAEHHQGLVDQRAPEHGCNDADGERHYDPEHRRADEQRQGDGHGLHDGGDDLLAAVDEGGEVAGDEEALHHQPVLHPDGPVEAEIVAHGGEHLRRGIAACDPGRRVGAGRREEDQEQDNRDAEHHEQHLAETAQQHGRHQPFTRSLAFGSSASRTPSPKTLRATTVITTAMPGSTATSGRV